ncbi:helix-turn-helix domain-containing protein [Pelosinus fermentans]|uniref:Transcriptional regulator, XRE family n=1 Tax=Pelosinus fermentans JBW45 TaxID=1192197 RepID=I9NUD1_9FIRM|nr:helix-turn-helix transcriptional regulator [Pelosinus fermentans]AJQ30039.1 transcriptional regulator, XRE family [Pelosinus fermentans JBW45]
MEFKERLKELRLNKKMTQEELGKTFNVIKQTISSWENGNSRPDIYMASKIADFFEVTTDYLLGRTNEPKATKEIPTVSAHHTNNPMSDLPPEALERVEEFKELMRLKYGKKPT